MISFWLLLGNLFLGAGFADAEVRGRDVEYKHGDLVLEGFLAEPAKGSGKLPAVIVFHEWDGLGDYVKRRARMLAELGYVAFAADVYGKGVRAKSPEESQKLSAKYREDRALTRGRAQAALDYVRALPNVNTDRIGAIGYCFGGMVALELARSGAPVAATVSFHGNLATPNPADAKQIKGGVLVLNGDADPLISKEEIAGFKDEMEKAGVRYKFIGYPGAVHAFTNPARVAKPGAAAAYHARADKDSWQEMRRFLKAEFAR